jgi:DNA-binding response OmpR family regulator
MGRPETGATDARFTCDVVIVDDYRALALEIAEGLGRRGLSLEVVHDGAAARALAARACPAVALVDCHLPDVHGLHLIRQLGLQWPDTTFLAISGELGGVTEDMARALRIHAFLNKPLPMRPLVQAVERLVAASRDRTLRQQAPRPWIALGIGSPAGHGTAPVIELRPPSP